MRRVQLTRRPNQTLLSGTVPLFLCLLFAAATASNDVPHELAGKVIGVHDGDTITLLVDGRQQYKIRLEGIDAPELGQDYGTQAKKALSSAIFGKEVRVETHGRDRYGRVLGIVFLGSFDINRGLVQHGWAWHYVEYSNSKELADAEKEAREKKAGLWAGKTPTPPWEWRTAKRAADLAAKAKSKSAAKENRTPRPPPKAAADDNGASVSTSAKYWLNTSSNVRHNSGCRYFSNTKAGRFCGPNEGKTCGICGG